MRLHILQHVSFESEAGIADWARIRGHSISKTRLFSEDQLPTVNSYDWLIIMGGPMNVYEVSEYPFLKEEKTYIRQAIDSGKKVIGICLGAQLIAHALDSKVFKNKEKEIGWFNVNLIQGPEAAEIFSGIPLELRVFQWHGDTFDIPEGAVRLASSIACQNQAFVYKNALALQFHLETTPESLGKLIDNCKNEIRDAKYIQSAEQMQANAAYFTESNQNLYKLLDNFAVFNK